MKKYKQGKELNLYGNFRKDIRIPEIKVRYNRGKAIDKIVDMSSAHEFLKRVYGRDIAIQEHFVVLLLDNSLHVIGYYKHTIGTPSSTIVDIPMLLGVALKTLSRAIIVSHNHPSGKNEPSNSDNAMTNRIKTATKAVDIRFVDHVIVTPGDEYYSYTENSFPGLGGFGSNSEIIEQKLRQEILSQLKRVNKINAPKIFQIIQTQTGYERIERRIINMVINENITPSACIPQIESELL